MRSRAAKALQESIDAYWDDHARLLGHREGREFRPVCIKDGSLTQAEFIEYTQKILNALHRCIKGNGHRHGFVKIVSGRSKSYADLASWRINIDDSWRLIVHNYTWNWTEEGKSFDMRWMRHYRKATEAFFTRALYLPTPKAEAKPAPTKDEARRGKIKALEKRRRDWTVQERARKWLIKIDRSLRALRRYVQDEEN